MQRLSFENPMARPKSNKRIVRLVLAPSVGRSGRCSLVLSSSPRGSAQLSERLRVYVSAIELFALGLAITGFAAYGEAQSMPYMVQISHMESSAPDSPIPYSELSSAEKSVFDRLKTGHSDSNLHFATIT